MKRRGIVALLLVLFIGGSVLAWTYWPKSVDPELVAAQQRMAELSSQVLNPLVEMKPMSPEMMKQSLTAMNQIREEMEKLTPEQRRQLWQNGGERTMRQQFKRAIDDYFALPPEKRREHMDKRIDQMEALANIGKTMQAAGNLFGRRGGQNQSGNQPANNAQNNGGPPGGDNQGQRGGGGGGWRGPSPEGRAKWLDSSTPEDRAKFVEYGRQMAQRRAERGLPPMDRGFGR